MEPDFDVSVAIGRGGAPGDEQALASADQLPERAFANFRRAADGEPLDADYAYILGTALAERGRHAEAVAAFQDAIALDRGQPSYFVALGASRWHLRRYDEAAAAFEDALALAPGDASALNGLGVARLGQGRATDASAVLEEAASVSPEAWEPAVNAAVARWRAGDRTRALEALRRAADTWRDEVPVLRPLARALAAQGAEAEALALFERIAGLAPRDPTAHLDRGDSLHRLDRAEAADAAYEEAQRLDPRAFARRPGSHDRRRAIALGRLRAELAPDRSAGALLSRGLWSVAGTAGHLLRHLPARVWRSALSLRGLVWTVPTCMLLWCAAVAIPVHVRHHLLQDDVRTIARTPFYDDALVRERLRDAVAERGLSGRIGDDCFAVTTEPRLRTIECSYTAPLSFAPGVRREQRFRLRAREVFLVRPEDVHY